MYCTVLHGETLKGQTQRQQNTQQELLPAE